MTTLSGKSILITGAAHRLGRTIALQAASLGAPLALHGNTSMDALKQTALDCKVAGAPMVTLHQRDLSECSTVGLLVEEAWKQHEGLYGLVNNASLFFPTPWEKLEAESWQSLMNVNALAPAILAATLAAKLKAASSPGRIINLVDVAAEQSWSTYGAYGASKAALAYTTRSQAKAWAKDQITVNGVSPGAALFPDDMDQAARQKIINKIPQGHAQTPDDIAQVVAFLLTGPSSITGHIIPVDGGSLLGH